MRLLAFLFFAPLALAQTGALPLIDTSSDSCLHAAAEPDSVDYFVLSTHGGEARRVTVGGAAREWAGSTTVCGPLELGKDVLGPSYVAVSAPRTWRSRTRSRSTCATWTC